MDTKRKPFAAQQPERIRLSGQIKRKLRARSAIATIRGQDLRFDRFSNDIAKTSIPRLLNLRHRCSGKQTREIYSNKILMTIFPYVHPNAPGG